MVCFLTRLTSPDGVNPVLIASWDVMSVMGSQSGCTIMLGNGGSQHGVTVRETAVIVAERIAEDQAKYRAAMLFGALGARKRTEFQETIAAMVVKAINADGLPELVRELCADAVPGEVEKKLEELGRVLDEGSNEGEGGNETSSEDPQTKAAPTKSTAKGKTAKAGANR